jgi:hypothetical protein
VRFVLLFLSLPAFAVELPCSKAEKGAMQVDGLIDEWADVQGVDAEGGSPNFAFSVRCSLEHNTLFLLVTVQDNYLVRTAAHKPSEDHIELRLGAHHFSIYPGDGKNAQFVTPGGLRVQTPLEEQGWAVELSAPFSLLGLSKSSALLKFDVKGVDCDSKASLKAERTLHVSGDLTIGESGSAVEAFLQSQSLHKQDIFAQRSLRLGKEAARALIVRGNLVLVEEERFVFVGFPVMEAKDLKDARVMDVVGDGQQALVVRYEERGGGGSREVLAIYRFPSAEEAPVRYFAAEVAKQSGKFRLQSKYTFVPRGRARDLVLTAGKIKSHEGFEEAPANDMVPILLPSDKSKARYRFLGDRWESAD